MKKRLLALLLAVCMVAGLAACGGNSSSSSSGGSSSDTKAADTKAAADAADDTQAPAVVDGDYPEIVFAFRVSGSVPSEADLARVEEALNVITREKIGCEVSLLYILSSSYQQQMTLMLSGDEQLDIMYSTASMIPPAVGAEQLRDLTDLLDQYGQGIKDVLGEDLLSCGVFKGGQYCLPVVTEGTLGYGMWMMKKEIVDKYEIDVDSIKSYEDLTEVFQLVHENEPDLTIVAPNTGIASFMQYCCTWDKLSDYFGVLDDYGQNLEVVNLFETQSYRDYLDIMRDWYQKGFISSDVTNNTESAQSLMKAGTLFAFCESNKPGIETQDQIGTGCEVVGVQLQESMVITNNNGQWTIPENSKYPELAMQFLNLMYTDSDVINILAYGIEGEDYVVREDGRIGYPEGIDASNVGYSRANQVWALGNQFNAYVWETNDIDLWEQTAAWAKTGIKSKAYGFTFDPTPVSNEEAAVKNVYDQYSMSLECGVVDPETTLAEMNEKLYAAGLQAIIDEKQKQLDEWAAANGVE